MYEFVAEEVGTHYWHGHFSMERADGFHGAITIRDSENVKDGLEYDDELVLFVEDYYHVSSFDQAVGLESEPFNWVGNAQSFLIGGRGLFSSCQVNDTTTTTEPLEGCASLCTAENSYNRCTPVTRNSNNEVQSSSADLPTSSPILARVNLHTQAIAVLASI